MSETKLRKDYKTLTVAVRVFLDGLDREMGLPSTDQSPQRIAQLANELNLAHDMARRFGLGLDYRTNAKAKP